MNINKIQIPIYMLQTTPRSSKVREARMYWYKHHSFDKPIIVDDENTLLDGYARLIAARQIGLKSVPVIKKFDLVNAIHENGREYTWWNRYGIDCKVGDRIMVESGDNEAPKVVVVTKVWDTTDLDAQRHKRVLGLKIEGNPDFRSEVKK